MNTFFGWRMVAIAIAIDFFAVGFAFQTYPVIQLHLEEELKLSRFVTTLSIPIFMMCSAIFFPIVGRLLDQYSVKKIIVWGGFIYSISLMSLYLTFNYLTFILIYGLPIALGATLMGNLATSKLVSSWFEKQAGRALGFAAVGVSFAGFIFPNLTQYFLMDVLLLEWREVYLVFGLFLLVIITPLIFLLVIDKPEDIGQEVDGGLEDDETQPDDNFGIEWEIKDLLRNKNFWILTVVFSLQFSSMMAILAHLTFYAAERGWADQAAFIFGMYAIPAMLSKVVFGWLVEKKLDPRMAVSISLALQALGLLLITVTQTPTQLALVIALFGFGGGAGLPMSNILFRNTFTPKSFGTSRGLSQPFIFLFQAIGTPGVALLFQYYGSYDNAFLMLTVMVVLAIFVIWLMEKPQDDLVSSS
jgi:MFS family permease|tara:strand:+ start:1666 stop:2910 length:1245 start_codon:yes stop_codon:yes gene_type:complete